MMQNSQEQKRMPLIENRTLCLTILLMALVYNVIFGCVRNPLGEENTISWIGYDHPFAFLVWGGLTAAAFFLNISYLYHRYHYAGKIGTISLYTAPMMAMTVIFINDWGWEHVLHWIGAIGFIALNGAALLLFFLHHFKTHISYKITSFAVAGMLLAMLGVFADGWEKRVTGACADVDCDDPVVPGEFYGDLPRDGASGRVRGTGKGSEESGEIGLGARHIRCASVLSELLAAGAWPLWMTYVGCLFCLDRFIGMGNINGIEGESAWIYLAVGFSILIGSAAWAVCDALELHRGVRKEARAYAYASQSR